MNSATPFKKPLREKLMNMCGMYWWPPRHNDPRIKGPQPRLVTREQYERLMKMREEHGEDDGPSCVVGDNTAD